MTYNKIKKIVDKLAVPTLIAGILGVTVYFSRPEYREFVPTSGNAGYYLNINRGRTEVQGRSGFRYVYIIDSEGDLKPNYTKTGIAASVRLAGEMKRDPTEKEKIIFDDVLKKSKRFGKSLENNF